MFWLGTVVIRPVFFNVCKTAKSPPPPPPPPNHGRKFHTYILIYGLGKWKNIFRTQTFHFCQNFLTLFIFHQYKPFGLKNRQKVLFFGQNRGKQTKSKQFLENRQTWCWNITYFSNPDIRPIGKKLDHFKVNSQRRVGSPGSDPSKRHDLSVWNHISVKSFCPDSVGAVHTLKKNSCPKRWHPWGGGGQGFHTNSSTFIFCARIK